jgi:hypothetical protein
MAKKSSKKRNPQDTTLRNNRAIGKRVTVLERLVEELIDNNTINNPRFYRHLMRIKNG